MPLIINRYTILPATVRKTLLWQMFLKESLYLLGTFFSKYAMNSWFREKEMKITVMLVNYDNLFFYVCQKA